MGWRRGCLSPFLELGTLISLHLLGERLACQHPRLVLLEVVGGGPQMITLYTLLSGLASEGRGGRLPFWGAVCVCGAEQRWRGDISRSMGLPVEGIASLAGVLHGVTVVCPLSSTNPAVPLLSSPNPTF